MEIKIYNKKKGDIPDPDSVVASSMAVIKQHGGCDRPNQGRGLLYQRTIHPSWAFRPPRLRYLGPRRFRLGAISTSRRNFLTVSRLKSIPSPSWSFSV